MSQAIVRHRASAEHEATEYMLAMLHEWAQAPCTLDEAVEEILDLVESAIAEAGPSERRAMQAQLLSGMW